VVRPPARPEPGRGRGRPPLPVEEVEWSDASLPPLTRIERRRFDYSELEAAIAHAQQVTRQTRRAVDGLIRAAPGPAEDGIDPVPIPDKAVASANITGCST
jgi:hypothetical protein